MHCVAFLSKSKFSPFIIVMHESLNCPQCKKMDFKIIQLCWKGFKYAEDAGKF